MSFKPVHFADPDAQRRYNELRIIRDSTDPTSVAALEELIAAKKPNKAIETQQVLQQKPEYQQWAREIEDVWAQHRGQLPIEFLASLDPEDVQFFAQADPEVTGLSNELMKTLEMLTGYYDSESQFQQVIEQTQKQVEQFDNANDLFGLLETKKIADDPDAVMNLLLQNLEREQNPSFITQVARATGEGLSRFIDTAAMLVGEGFTRGIHLVGALFPIGKASYKDNLRIAFGPIRPSDDERSQLSGPELQEARDEKRRVESGLMDEDLRKQLRTNLVPQAAWDWLIENRPDEVRRRVEEYGDFELARMGFFVELADSQQLDVTVEEQLEDLRTAQAQTIDGMIRTLEDQNYRNVGNGLFDFLAGWGMLLSSVVTTGLAAGKQMWEHASVDMDELAQEVEKAGHMPSGVFGLEGTGFGVLLDFFGPAAIDPFVWGTMPMLRGGRNALNSQAAINTVMKSPVVRWSLRDMAKLADRPSTNVIGLHKAVSAFDEVGLGGEIRTALGLKSKVLGGDPWLIGPRTGAMGRYVPTEWVLTLLDDVDQAALAELRGTKQAAELATSIRRDGFREPLLLEYDPVHKTIGLADGGGLKRLAAVEQIENLADVPAVVRVLNENQVPSSPRGRPLAEVGQEPTRLRRQKIAKSDYAAPSEFMAPEHFKPLDERLTALEAVTREALARGADLPFARMTIAAYGLGKLFSKTAETTVGEKLTPYLRTSYNSPFVPPTADGLTSTALFIGAGQPEWMRSWTLRIYENAHAMGRVRTSKSFMRQALADLRTVSDKLTDLQKASDFRWTRDMAQRLTNDTSLRQVLGRSRTLEQARLAVRKRILKTESEIHRRVLQDAGAISWDKLFIAMYEDFNRKFIAKAVWDKEAKGYVGTNPQWASKVDRKTGLVPWDELRRWPDLPENEEIAFIRRGPRHENPIVAALQKDKFIELTGNVRVEAADALTGFRALGEGSDVVRAPITPIELVAASQTGPTKYTQLSHQYLTQDLKNFIYTADSLWKTNVLLTPRTMFVVSFDEISSHLQAGGLPYVQRYIQMRADSIKARFESLRQGKGFRRGPGGLNVDPVVRQRLTNLLEVPEQLRAYSTQLAEAASKELTVMKPTMPGYRDAAMTWSQSYLQNPAFRAYLRGKDAFLEWAQTYDGQDWLLGQTVKVDMDGRTRVRPLVDAEEGFALVDGIYRLLEDRAKKAGLPDSAAWREGWAEAAARIEADPQSGRINSVPEWMFEYFGDIPGYMPVYPGLSRGLWMGVASAFEAGMGNPAATRQALLAQAVREAETTRLRTLFLDQGKKIVSDYEMLDIVRRTGQPISEVNPYNLSRVENLMWEAGYVPESYIARLAENAAMRTTEEMTYLFEHGSRFGRQAQSIFPFGRAWGDMYGRWGRMLGTRMILRPALGEKLGRAAPAVQGLLDRTPINMRTWSFISRLANTDLSEIDIPFMSGQQKLDFSPITFLPTADSQDFSSLIAGVGVWPSLALDGAISAFGPDPVDEPDAYQDLIENLSTVWRASFLHGRGLPSRLLGSGLTGLFINLANSLSIGLAHNPDRNLWRFTGNARAEMLRYRAVSAEFGNPENMDLILNQTDPDIVDALILERVFAADRVAARTDSMENILRFATVARGPLDPTLDQLYDRWIEIGRAFPDYFLGEDIPSDDVLEADLDRFRRTGDSIRRQFFERPRWQRDLIVALYPQLAANLVTGWEWSDVAPDELTRDGIPYRTIGADPDDKTLSEMLERHNLYVSKGWVVPRDSRTRPHEIIGTALDARDRITRYLYETTAQTINDELWETVVSEKTKRDLQIALQDPKIQRLGITDPRELWERWATFREEIEDELLREWGLEPNTEEGDKALQELRDIFGVPSAERAWSTKWRGDDIDSFAARVKELPVRLTEEGQLIASQLGLDVADGMPGEDFILALHDYRSKNVRNAAWYAVQLQYSAYKEERGRAFSTASAMLRGLVNDTQLNDNFRESVDEFLQWVDITTERYADSPTVPRAVQDEAVQRFNILATSTRDAPVNWDKLWQLGFASRFGPRDWEPPTPAPIRLEDGTLNPNAWQPFIQDVVDGDTLVVSEFRGPALIDAQPLGFPLRVGERKSGPAEGHFVRLLGVLAADRSVDLDASIRDTTELVNALAQARERGDTIWLVRDPDYAKRHVDAFGRELAWLYIGDEPYYFPERLERGS